jgi:hypothetical protein
MTAGYDSWSPNFRITSMIYAIDAPQCGGLENIAGEQCDGAQRRIAQVMQRRVSTASMPFQKVQDRRHIAGQRSRIVQAAR